MGPSGGGGVSAWVSNAIFPFLFLWRRRRRFFLARYVIAQVPVMFPSVCIWGR